MPRRPVIRVRATVEIPYDRKQFGAATAAEAHALGIKKAIEQVLADATMTAFVAEHTTTAALPEPQESAVDDVPEMPAALRRT